MEQLPQSPIRNSEKEISPGQIESKEQLKPPAYEITINREKIAGLDISEEMKGWLRRLPETIKFEDQVTLIVSEDNGVGKTSLGKAIMNARANYLKQRYPEAKIMDLFLEKNEPAAQLVDILQCVETRKNPNFKAYSIDGEEISRRMKEWAKQQPKFDPKYTADGITGGAYTHKLSSRQLFDQALDELRASINRRMFPDIDFMFDEPEQGMSPQRQLKLVADITKFPQSGDSLLVPTNSLVLFLSDLPRLNLSQPERGVYKPSDFGEYVKINLPNRKE